MRQIQLIIFNIKWLRKYIICSRSFIFLWLICNTSIRKKHLVHSKTPYIQTRTTKGGGGKVRLYLQWEVVLEGEWKVWEHDIAVMINEIRIIN